MKEALGRRGPGYLPRVLDTPLQALMSELPAVLLVGPRAAGKTTTARRHAATTVRLDREAEAVAFRADPDAALRGLPEPILLDEWQLVPGVLGAVKRAVDDDPRAGRFLITGSVRAELDAATWPGTGRLVRLALFGLTVREQLQRSTSPSLAARIASDGVEAALGPVADPPDLRGYIELALRSGFPEPALHLGAAARDAWLASYLEQLLTRDVARVDGGRDPERLRRYLKAYGARTARVVDDKTIWESAGVNRKTALAYEQLLADLYVVDRLPAFGANRLKQLVRSPRRHVVEPALAAAALGMGEDDVIREGGFLGGLLESFVVAQVRAELSAAARAPALYHLRTEGGRHEVDLLIELPGGKLIAVEVKATAAPNVRDAAHLEWLAEALPDRFVAGLVLHTGPRAFALSPRVVAAPIAALWSP